MAMHTEVSRRLKIVLFILVTVPYAATTAVCALSWFGGFGAGAWCIAGCVFGWASMYGAFWTLRTFWGRVTEVFVSLALPFLGLGIAGVASGDSDLSAIGWGCCVFLALLWVVLATARWVYLGSKEKASTS